MAATASGRTGVVAAWSRYVTPAFEPGFGGLLTGQVYEPGISVTPLGDTPFVTTQLRLVEPPEPRSRPAKDASKASSTAATRAPSKGTVRRARTNTARSGRRAASWGEWRLDAGTRQVGRAGVAQARRALEAALEQAALEQELSEAS
jgi:hypothetical protein